MLLDDEPRPDPLRHFDPETLAAIRHWVDMLPRHATWAKMHGEFTVAYHFAEAVKHLRAALERNYNDTA
jgi:hypothetical protein